MDFISVEALGNYAHLTFQPPSALLPEGVIYVAWLRDGRAVEGGGEPLPGDRATGVAVYRANRVDRTALTEDLVFELPDDMCIALVARWNESTAAGLEMSLGPEGDIQTRDLGTATDVAEYLHSMQMLERRAPQPSPSGEAFHSLVIRGFRGFAERTELEIAKPTGLPGSGLTLLVGANNGGKSTFLEALQILARARNFDRPSFPKPQRHHSIDEVQLTLTRDDGRSLQVKTIRPGGNQANATWLPSPDAREQFAIFTTPARRAFSPYFGNSGTADRDWNTHDEMSRTQLRDSFVGRLKKVDRDAQDRETFDALLAEIVGYRLNWTFDDMGNGQQFVKLTEPDGSWHTSEGLGEGLVSLLFIVDALYDSMPGSLIAIDEPELSLHPQLIRRLQKVFSRFAADRQIVIATHSPLLIGWDDVAAGASIARVHKVSGKAGLAQVSPATLSAVAALASSGNTHNPHTLGEVAKEAFFLEDGILLLEGTEDVTHLPVVLGDLGLPEFDNVYGWGAGGVTNMPLLARLFQELGFSRIAVLVDGDDHAGTNKTVADLGEMGPTVLVRRHPAEDIRTKKASPAKPEKVGLLDSKNRGVRPEFVESAKSALEDLRKHLNPG